MPKNRAPQTFEKRRREREKQEKRQAKLARRLERNAAKRNGQQEPEAVDPDATQGGTVQPPPKEP